MTLVLTDLPIGKEYKITDQDYETFYRVFGGMALFSRSGFMRTFSFWVIPGKIHPLLPELDSLSVGKVQGSPSINVGVLADGAASSRCEGLRAGLLMV
jgi:hypothetical protein